MIVFGAACARLVVCLSIPLLGWLLSIFVFCGSAVLWLLLMFKAYQGETLQAADRRRHRGRAHLTLGIRDWDSGLEVPNRDSGARGSAIRGSGTHGARLKPDSVIRDQRFDSQ